MAKSLYIGKMAMCLHQLPDNIISQPEAQAVKRLAIFISLFYAKYWLEAPLTAAAPRTDITFWKDMKHFEV
jgi:hypothetical protein